MTSAPNEKHDQIGQPEKTTQTDSSTKNALNAFFAKKDAQKARKTAKATIKKEEKQDVKLIESTAKPIFVSPTITRTKKVVEKGTTEPESKPNDNKKEKKKTKKPQGWNTKNATQPSDQLPTSHVEEQFPTLPVKKQKAQEEKKEPQEKIDIKEIEEDAKRIKAAEKKKQQKKKKKTEIDDILKEFEEIDKKKGKKSSGSKKGKSTKKKK